MGVIASPVDITLTEGNLTNLRKGEHAIVTGLCADNNPEHEVIKTRLLELGFVDGETVGVVAEGFPSRDPIAVRLGNSTFALRRHEAAMIQIRFRSREST